MYMKLIAGLGNKGNEYIGTRHNIGFIIVDKLRDKLADGKNFSLDSKFEAEVLRTKKFILCKPQTFMNNSGRSVRKIMDYYKVGIEDLVVIHDDLDIRLGEYKMKVASGPKIHNGLNSVEQTLGSKDFMRVRVGVDNRNKEINYGSGADYVLSKFGKEEETTLDKVLEEIVDELVKIIED